MQNDTGDNNNKHSHWLRWMAVLPGAILVACLINIHWIWRLFCNLENGEMIPSTELNPLRDCVHPFITALLFVYTGYKIAPTNQKNTAIVLVCIYSVYWSIASALAIQGWDLFLLGKTGMGFLGVIMGLCAANLSEYKITVSPETEKD